MNLKIEGTVTIPIRDYHRLLDLAEKGVNNIEVMQTTINTLDTIKSNLERSLYGKSNAWSDIGRTIEEMEKRINRSPLRG